jgi:ABC-type sugar transport system ATPase subunit
MDAHAITVRGVAKRYGSTQALSGVDLELRPGEIHGLIGPNGAGKSTLVKILAGVVRPDAGEIAIGGRVVRIERPADALGAGLSFVHQQLLVAPGLSVLDNIFVGLDTPVRLRRVDRKAMRRKIAPVLDLMQVDLDLGESIERLSVTEQRFMMIARALYVDARTIVLDEPTASLDVAEVESLFRVLRQLRAQGFTVLFISHRLGEVLDLCDRITVLRDGRTTSTRSAGELEHDDLLRAMGAEDELPRPSDSAGTVDERPEVLTVRGLTAPHLSGPISFGVRAGEIVGLAGVVGSGRSRLAKALVGVIRRTGGEVIVEGTRPAGDGPGQSGTAGVVLLPENRAADGLSLAMKVRENVTLGVLPQVYRRSPLGTRRRARERALAADLLERVGLDPGRMEAYTSSLSGGMQQRVMFAKALAADARIVVLDEPTQGVDVATKQSLHHLIRQMADDGRGIVVISSELEELVALSDRVLCLHEGRITHELAAPGLTPGRIINALWDQREAAA